MSTSLAKALPISVTAKSLTMGEVHAAVQSSAGLLGAVWALPEARQNGKLVTRGSVLPETVLAYVRARGLFASDQPALREVLRELSAQGIILSSDEQSLVVAHGDMIYQLVMDFVLVTEIPTGALTLDQVQVLVKNPRLVQRAVYGLPEMGQGGCLSARGSVIPSAITSYITTRGLFSSDQPALNEVLKGLAEQGVTLSRDERQLVVAYGDWIHNTLSDCVFATQA